MMFHSVIHNKNQSNMIKPDTVCNCMPHRHKESLELRRRFTAAALDDRVWWAWGITRKLVNQLPGLRLV